MLFLDTETCGLTGPIVLIQFAEIEKEVIEKSDFKFDRNGVQLHHVWLQPFSRTLLLLEKIANSEIVLFNLVFDQFQLTKLYNHFKSFVIAYPDLIEDKPINHINALYTHKITTDFCFKPKNCLDIWLHALQGEWQCTMERKDIVIRTVPFEVCDQLVEYLNKIDFVSPMLFARSSIPKMNWKVRKSDRSDRFRDVYLKFKASSSLKAFAKFVLGYEIQNLKEIFENVPYPKEYGYAWNKCEWGEKRGQVQIRSRDKTKKIMVELDCTVIEKHIQHWRDDSLALTYATDDIQFTACLYKHFGCPPMGDNNSILASISGNVRYRGYTIDLDHLARVRETALVKTNVPQAPAEVKKYINEVIPEGAKLKSTNKAVLLKLSAPCEFCHGTKIEKCDWCVEGPTEVARRAKLVLEARSAQKEVELYDKLIFAGRFYPSVKVLGSLSGRMSGTDGLNALGIKRDNYVRQSFTLTDDPLYVGFGGDFDSYEVSIADAVYNDEELHALLMTGMKVHALFGAEMYGMSYQEVYDTQDLDGGDNLYNKAKTGFFALLYGAMAMKLSVTLGISIEKAEEGLKKFLSKYERVGLKRKEVDEAFAALHQKRIGSKISFRKPAEYIESLLGFKRYFTLENKFIEFLFNLANNLPEEFKKYGQKVTRKDREQTAYGAMMTAIYAAAFNIQSRNQRSANNHIIQSTGSDYTKILECRIWKHQPVGIGPWIVQPFPVHDEILCVVRKGYEDVVKTTVAESIKEFSGVVPLIAMKWKKMKHWGQKKQKVEP